MVNKSINMQNYIRWFLGIALIGAAVYGNSYFFQEPLLYRVLGVIVVAGIGLFVLTTTEEGKESLKVILESRTEIRRVVWPTRTETIQTTLIVLVAITIAALVLWGLDSLFGWGTAKLLG
ncbi:MAG TPA: preprotein translocase subunit SecE [SAR86 cluster bacterium]|jgi:preprotein translocase subunit SecE|nr:preprotein translocase subunit SecE [SAR86 cluster bacterium]